MHRLMVTSAAYRQSSTIEPETLRADPENVLLSRMSLRRMDAEQLHDSSCGCRPAVPQAVRSTGSGRNEGGGEVVEKASKDEWRGAIYLLQRRTTPVTLLEVFDLPPMSPNCTERSHSTVPTQALEMRNSALVLEHARYLAGRLIDEFPASPSRVEAAYLGRCRVSRPRVRWTALGDLERLTSKWHAHLRPSEPRPGHDGGWHALGDLVMRF